MNTDQLEERLPEQVRHAGIRFDDRLAVVSVAVGAFLVVVGLATVAGMPWTHKTSAGAAGLQVLGALATAAVGAGLIWFSQVRQ